MNWFKANQYEVAELDAVLRGSEAKMARCCAFAAERMNIFWRRCSLNWDKPEFTSDPVLQRYKFTNCYRILDKVSQYLIRNISNEDASDVSQRIAGRRKRLYRRFVRTYLFKMFNSIETWEALPDELKEPLHFGQEGEQWRTPQIERWALERQASGLPCFGNAYLMAPPDGRMYTSRVGLYLGTMGAILLSKQREETPLWMQIMEAEELSTSFAILKKFNGFGDFLAYQFAMDFAYGAEQPVNFNTFVVPGPGCIRGMQKVFGNIENEDIPIILKALYVNQIDLFKKCKVQFPWLERAGTTFYLQVNDFQNLFCEFDKYSRVTYPELEAAKTRSKIKNTFVQTTHEPLTWHTPRNWV